jgi:hypothetical protein
VAAVEVGRRAVVGFVFYSADDIYNERITQAYDLRVSD